MQTEVGVVLAVAGLFLAGFVSDLIGRHTFLPRVTLLLLFGAGIGPEGLDLLPKAVQGWFPTISAIALAMVGFLLGGEFSVDELRRRGRTVLVISAAVVVTTALIVFLGLLLAGASVGVAMLLAAVAAATAPAATMDVVREARAKGPFSRTLLGIVGIDDAWGLILFSVVLACVPTLAGSATGLEMLSAGVWDVLGAVLVGLTLGIPMAYLTGRIAPGEPTVGEAVGIVLLCAGLALWLDVSYLLASIVLGAVVVNRARHHRRPFHAIEGIDWPFLTLFFILAGASLRLDAVAAAGWLGGGYVLLRTAGKIVGAWLGATVAGADHGLRRWLGVSLLPQAGVALGMALIAVQQFPELETTVLPIVIGSTVLFEITGPVLTRLALAKAGESRQRDVGTPATP